MHHRRRFCFRIALLVASLAACDGSDDPEARPSRAECEAYRDNIIALRLAEVTADRAQHEASMRSAFGPEFVNRCMASSTRGQVRCATEADDNESLFACVR